jgi:hypothetical protein
MRRARLPDGYVAALESGLWPSRDVLPATERRRTGVPLDPASVDWGHESGICGSAPDAMVRPLWPAQGTNPIFRSARP